MKKILCAAILAAIAGVCADAQQGNQVIPVLTPAQNCSDCLSPATYGVKANGVQYKAALVID